MVAGYGQYRTVSPITPEEARFQWQCVTCGRSGQLMEIQGYPERQVTRFIILCSSGVVTFAEMPNELLALRPATMHFEHQRREASPLNDVQIRCLSGCGEVINSVVLTDHARDGRNITPGCRGPRFTIFVSEQLWRSGISRISYRHDGNYVIFDRDMKLVAEGREASPEWPQEALDVDVEEHNREYHRRMASTLHPSMGEAIGNPQAQADLIREMQGQMVNAMDEQINRDYASILSGTHTVTSTNSVPSLNLSDYQRHAELLRETAILHQQEAERQRRRNQRARAPMTEADLEREQIWRDYMNSNPRNADDLRQLYSELAAQVAPTKKPEPRRRRAVIRRALEKK